MKHIDFRDFSASLKMAAIKIKDNIICLFKCVYDGKPNTCRYCSKLLTSQHMQKSKECWKQCVLQFPEAQKNVPENRKPERENIAQKRSYRNKEFLLKKKFKMLAKYNFHLWNRGVIKTLGVVLYWTFMNWIAWLI